MSDGPTRTRRIEPVWGTMLGVDVRDHVAMDVLDGLFTWFALVDSLFSTWRPDSEISRFGTGQIARRDTSFHVQEVLDRCDELTEQTCGAFDIAFAADPRVEQRPGFAPIDPSGFVKGWALDRAASMLEHANVHNFSLNAGGDVVTRGRPEPDRAWEVGIQHPIDPLALAAVVNGTNLAVATSGRYERGNHIVNPRTGSAATELLAATIVSNDLGRADAYATAAMVLGSGCTEWLTSLDDIDMLLITNDHRVIHTDRFTQPSFSELAP